MNHKSQNNQNYDRIQ